MAIVAESIVEYNLLQEAKERAICELLATEITKRLSGAENKVWHRHPVWFIDGNPIVGYSKEKKGLRLMFWSGVDFEESNLKPGTGKFKDASIYYNSPDELNKEDLGRWLEKAQNIQWDYKNIIKNKGVLVRLK
jgi:hypothetical protein